MLFKKWRNFFYDFQIKSFVRNWRIFLNINMHIFNIYGKPKKIIKVRQRLINWLKFILFLNLLAI